MPDIAAGESVKARQYNVLRSEVNKGHVHDGTSGALISLLRAGSSGGVTVLSSDAFTVDGVNSFYYIDVQSGVSDDLSTISGGTIGDIVILTPASALRSITVKHNTGNIQLNNAYDHILNSADQSLVLRYNGTMWYEIVPGRVAPLAGVLSGGGGAIASGAYVDMPIMPAFYILGCFVMADQSGSIALDVRVAPWPTVPVAANSIVASAPPSLVTQQVLRDITLTGWLRSFKTGMALRFIATGSATSVTQLSIALLLALP